MRSGALIALALLSGCSMAPKYVQPALPVPTSWPVGDAYLAQSEAALAVAPVGIVLLDACREDPFGEASGAGRMRAMEVVTRAPVLVLGNALAVVFIPLALALAL